MFHAYANLALEMLYIVDVHFPPEVKAARDERNRVESENRRNKERIEHERKLEQERRTELEKAMTEPAKIIPTAVQNNEELQRIRAKI